MRKLSYARAGSNLTFQSQIDYSVNHTRKLQVFFNRIGFNFRLVAKYLSPGKEVIFLAFELYYEKINVVGKKARLWK